MKQVKIFLGRFQPFTRVHLRRATWDKLEGPTPDFAKNMREEPNLKEIAKQKTVILVVSTPKSKVDNRHPFDDDLMKKEFDIIKKNYADKIEDILYVKSADICAWGELIKSKGYQASVWLTGSDEFPFYKGMAEKVPEYEIKNRDNRDCKDAYTKSFYVENIHRDEENASDFIETISGTKVRKMLAEDNRDMFKKMVPDGVDKYFDEFREAVLNAPAPVKKIKKMKNLKESIQYNMKSLVNYIKESLVTEGGHVFGEGSDKIKKEHIKNTLNRFIKEFCSMFPGVEKHFVKVQTLGSVGKKDYSGDIDLAIDHSCLQDLDDWGLDKEHVDELFEKFKKRARTAKPDQLMKRAILQAIGEKIEEKDGDILVNMKGTGGGTLFCEYDQYDENDKKIDGKRVQIDINFGDIDWLKFAYYSDAYVGNVKGLHRTQLMLHLFAYKGYVFSHNYGVKNKETQKIEATNPKEAVALLNKLYGIHLTEKTLENYHKLQEYLREHLDEKTLNGLYDIYLHTLDLTLCDIPEDMQEYWVKNQDRLNLKGKYLPDDSRLAPYKK